MPLWSSPQCGKGSPKCLIFNLEIQRENNDHFWFTVTKNLCFVPVSRSPCSEYHSSTDVQLRHSLIFFNDLVCECDIMLKCVSLTFESENACMTSHREVWESYNDSRSSTDNSTQSSHLVAKTRPAKDVKKSWDFLACENDKTAMTSPPPLPEFFSVPRSILFTLLWLFLHRRLFLHFCCKLFLTAQNMSCRVRKSMLTCHLTPLWNGILEM